MDGGPTAWALDMQALRDSQSVTSCVAGLVARAQWRGATRSQVKQMIVALTMEPICVLTDDEAEGLIKRFGLEGA